MNNNGAHLLDRAPAALRELPAWFRSLDPDQLRSVWVAAVVDGIVREGLNLPALAAALSAVRDLTMHHPGGATDGPAFSRPRKQTCGREKVIAIARAAAPRVGDQFVVREVFPDIKSCQIRYFLRGSPEFRFGFEQTAETRPRLIAVRVAVTDEPTSPAPA